MNQAEHDMLVIDAQDGSRRALQLFYVSGLRIPEIALVLDIPAGTVKSRLHRARGLLKDHFEGDDDEH
ncbi:sigma factor-like helix-turn-helix DNA-binding protein [Wenzhouxiangella limi]|uniref:RNA polymerase sigma factor 70 region 4 type 2 domain-containing protein n=1 Tax=Wenzhouxiangella limi TaxID=2707351 RepID=A0A845VH51_9GAMM|nr:sigma factor-like helix-turn-helix DNA-binding protein [Wenzhouxiangella limi]NDY96529.1 hypothetical protein [Wenzhouxiangella limi]